MDFMSRPAITGFMGGMAVVIMLQQLKGIVGMTHFTTKKVSAFVVGAVALIATPFAVPSASFTRDVGRAVAERAERDGGHRRGEAEAAREAGDRRGRSGTPRQRRGRGRGGGGGERAPGGRHGAAGKEEKSERERERGKGERG